MIQPNLGVCARCQFPLTPETMRIQEIGLYLPSLAGIGERADFEMGVCIECAIDSSGEEWEVAFLELK